MSFTPNEQEYSSFKLSKRFRIGDVDQQLTTLDYDDSGQFLISTSINQSIQMFDCFKGKFIKNIQSKKYGCHLAKFTHSNNNCIYASTLKNDHTIRYLSLVDNSFIRYFRGHKELVNSLEVSPTHDVVLSSSLDNSVRLWDLRASNSQAFCSVQGPSYVSFDPAGLVCAIGSSKLLQLKDIKMLDARPFLEVELPENFRYNKIEFSNDNKYILLSSTNGNHMILDAFDGKIITELGGISPIPESDFPYSGTASFTPDGKYVFSGNGDENVAIYNLKSIESSKDVLHPFKYLTSEFDKRPRMLSFNPKYAQFTTADVEVNMWIPDNDN